MSSRPAIVETLAELIAEHRVVPFLGAGCSVGHIRMDWDAVRDAMAESLGISNQDHLAVASQFVRTFGRSKLAEFLRDRLNVSKFDPTHGDAFMTMLGTRIGVMYTTNQDKLAELCFAEFGHQLSVVVDIDDIARLKPGDVVMYKFHGDLDKPESIVFTTEDYTERGRSSDHALDIRLRSDALAKSLLFIGYSFRDPNIQDLLLHLRGLFCGNLPKSYLVQYQPDPAFARKLEDDFGILSIDPQVLYPGVDAPSAFSRFLSDLGAAVVLFKSKNELAEIFSPRVPPARRITAAIEVDNVDAALSTSNDCDQLLAAFRATYDLAQIHETFSDRVAAQFVEICRRVDRPDQVSQVKGALHNLYLEQMRPALTASAAAHATANILPKQNGMKTTFHMPALNEQSRVFVTAYAIHLLREWDRKIESSFYDHVSFWEALGWPTRTELKAVLGAELLDFVEEQFKFAYQPGKTTYGNPLDRAEYMAKLPGRGRLLGASSFEEIFKSLRESMPKRFSKC